MIEAGEVAELRELLDAEIILRRNETDRLQSALTSTAEKLAHMTNERDRMRDAASIINGEVCQILGKALGFPWYKDDQKNFPGATEADGICEGHYVAQDMANLAAGKLATKGRAIDIHLSTITELQLRVEQAAEKLAKAEANCARWCEIGRNTDALAKELLGKAEAENERLRAALIWARDETDRFQSDGRIDWTEFYNRLSDAIDGTDVSPPPVQGGLPAGESDA